MHPTVEQQEQELELKAKMVEYKAIATGHVDNLPIKAVCACIVHFPSLVKFILGNS